MKVKKILAALLVASICSTAALAGCSVSILKVIVQVQEEAQLQVAQIPSHLLMSL